MTILTVSTCKSDISSCYTICLLSRMLQPPKQILRDEKKSLPTSRKSTILETRNIVIVVLENIVSLPPAHRAPGRVNGYSPPTIQTRQTFASSRAMYYQRFKHINFTFCLICLAHSGVHDSETKSLPKKWDSPHLFATCWASLVDVGGVLLGVLPTGMY